jgi:hypothetical protein
MLSDKVNEPLRYPQKNPASPSPELIKASIMYKHRAASLYSLPAQHKTGRL